MEGKVYIDSNAAIGVVSRRGNGKLRHVKVGDLWIQERVEERDLDVRNVEGENNPADLMTKNVDATKCERFTGMCGQECPKGKAEKSLELARF